MSLYRTEALNHQKNRFVGEILLTRQFPVLVLSVVAVVMTVGFVLFLVLGNYTQKQRVDGVLLPDKGLVKVQSPQAGTVQAVLVREGQRVAKGQTLYVIDSDKVDTHGRAVQADNRVQLEDQLRRLDEQIERQSTMTRISVDNLRQKKDSLQRQLRSLIDGMALAEAQVALTEKNLERYRALNKRQYASALEVEQKQEQFLNQQARIKDLQRSRMAMEMDIATTEKDIQNALLQGSSDISGLRKNQGSLRQEMLNSEVRRQIQVQAPVAGEVSAVLVKVGQTVGSQPLLTIVPEGAQLLAELYVPTHSIGFTRLGSPVQVRYPAFPFQKFGQHRGLVKEISHVAIETSELAGALKSSGSGSGGNSEALYRVIVALPSQTIKAYGKQEPLHAGMRVEADILRDTRHLYEWVLEPLYSVSGSL